jgi:hypothetical protein
MSASANRVAAALIVLGLALLLWTVPRAETRYRLVRCLPGEECTVRGIADNSTQCALDLASDSFVAPKGTRLRCEKITDQGVAKK